MKVYNHINIGDEIPILVGCLKVTYYNGEIFYVGEYEVDEDGNEIYVSPRMLTPAEIANLMQEVDGKTHIVMFADQA